MTKNKHLLVLVAIKCVLGKDCVEYEDKYRVNTDVCSHFVVSMLDICVPRPLILKLVKEIFPKNYLNGLGEVVTHAAYGIGLPTTSDLRRFIKEEDVVWMPFLNGFRLQTRGQHQQRVTQALHFLFQSYNVIPFYDVEWYTDFRDLVYPPPMMAMLNDAASAAEEPMDEEEADAAVDASVAANHSFD